MKRLTGLTARFLLTALLGALLGAGVAGVGALWYVRSLAPEGTTIVVLNRGRADLRSVVAHVGSEPYPLGDVESGASASVRVLTRPGDSVSVSHRESEGRLLLDPAPPRGRGGAVLAAVAADSVLWVSAGYD